MKMDTLFSLLTPMIWIVLIQDGYDEISGKKRGLYFISLIHSRQGNSICAWPFQGSAVWLDGCLCYHPLQPLLYVRNQGGLRSQSNMEYWKGYSSAADYKLSWTVVVINIPAPHSNDKDCNKNRWGRGVNFILLTMIGWEWLTRKGCPIYSSILHCLFIMRRMDFSIMNGGYVDINQDRGTPSCTRLWATLYYCNCLPLCFLSLVLLLHGI